jgi:hypothetical protein
MGYFIALTRQGTAGPVQTLASLSIPSPFAAYKVENMFLYFP